jgi:hypothetical protein
VRTDCTPDLLGLQLLKPRRRPRLWWRQRSPVSKSEAWVESWPLVSGTCINMRIALLHPGSSPSQIT